MHRVVLLASVVGACAGTIGTSPSENLDQNLPRSHEQATPDDQAPATYECGDSVLNDQLTSGGERLTTFQPCWDFDEERAARHEAGIDRERDEAQDERRAAAPIAGAQVDSNKIAACLPIVPGEREHSPFVHRKEIAEIVPQHTAGRLRGVKIVFKPVVGLTAAWLHNDIECQHARWVEAGKDPQVMTADPTLVEGADAQVFDRNGHVEVVVTTDTEEHAELALARARHEIVEPVAARK